jgi:hypothetical protein
MPRSGVVCQSLILWVGLSAYYLADVNETNFDSSVVSAPKFIFSTLSISIVGVFCDVN